MPKNNIPPGKCNISHGIFKGYTAPDEDVERPVPAELEGELYSRRKAAWQPVQVEIPERVHRIGYRSFEDCRGLTAVSIPNTVTEIGGGAFRRCSALTHITFPDRLRVIRLWAFARCTALTEVDIPDSVTAIEEGAFSDCAALTRISVPDSVKTIGESAFAGCTRLREITLPDAMCRRAKRIFGDLGWMSWRWFAGKLQVNPALDKVLRAHLKGRRKDFAEHVIASEDGEILHRYLALWDKVPLDFLDELIETSAHAQKAGITALLMQYKRSQYTQTQLENAQQRRAERELGLRNRSVADWRKIFVFHDEGGKLVITGYKGADDVVEVPAVIGKKPVAAIARWIPKGYEEQDEPYTVILPEGLQEIRKEAFGACRVKFINIPSTVTRIGERAFLHCSVLERISIPSRVTEIGAEAFKGCGKLKDVSISPGVTRIGAGAFEFCTGLERVDIPQGVTEVEADTFSSCDALESVTLPDSITYVNFYAFASCPKLLKLVLPAGVQWVLGNLGEWVFHSDTQVIAPRGSTTEETLKRAGIPYSLV